MAGPASYGMQRATLISPTFVDQSCSVGTGNVTSVAVAGRSHPTTLEPPQVRERVVPCMQWLPQHCDSMNLHKHKLVSSDSDIQQ